MKLKELNLEELDQEANYQTFIKRITAWPVISTDILIIHEEKGTKGIIMIERGKKPYGYALPGGLVEIGLSYEENAIKEAKEETNLDIELLNPQHPYTFSQPGRDPRGHVATQVFIAKSTGGTLRAGDDAAQAHLMTKEEIFELIRQDKLAFDHATIIKTLFEQEDIL